MGVVGHVAGPSGAGKTTLLSQLGKQHPDLVVKDLDDFDEAGVRALGFQASKAGYSDKMLQQLAAKRQQLSDDFLDEHASSDVLYGGHHIEGNHELSIPTDKRYLLSTSPARSAWRAVKRGGSLKDLSQNYLEGRRDVKTLKNKGYVGSSPREIQRAVASDLVKQAKAEGGFYKGEPASPDSVKFIRDFQGLKVKVDRPKGFIMTGTDAQGGEWKRKYKTDYGFIPKTLGGDGDGLDVFIGPNKKSKRAFWAVQRKDDGTFDEYKVFVGFENRDEAIACYRQHIPRKYFGRMVTMTIEMMKSMLGTNPDEVVTGVKTAMWGGFFDEMGKMADSTHIGEAVTPEMQEVAGRQQLLVPPANDLRHPGHDHLKMSLLNALLQGTVGVGDASAS